MRSKDTQIPEETYLSLVRAVITALNKHGYGDLTMRNIADEFDKSRGLLHYHFENKEELLAEVWDFIFERYVQSVDFDDELEPEDAIGQFLSAMLFGGPERDIDHWAVQTALLEFQLLARNDEWLRERVERVEERRIDILSGLIDRGIKDGTFKEVDTRATAAFLIGAAEAARIRKITLGWDDAPGECWQTLSGFILPALHR